MRIDTTKYHLSLIPLKLSWLQISDLKGFDGTAGKLYNIHAVPDNYLLDKEGKIVARNLRGDELEKKLSEIL